MPRPDYVIDTGRRRLTLAVATCLGIPILTFCGCGPVGATTRAVRPFGTEAPSQAEPFWGCDDNCSEILINPEGGYSWLSEGDQQREGSPRPQLQTTGRQDLNIVAERR